MMDLKVFFRTSRDQSSKMDKEPGMSPLRAKRTRQRKESQESAVSIELTRSGGEKEKGAEGGASSGKTVAFQPGPYGQHWNKAQEEDEELHIASDMSQEMNGSGGSDIHGSVNRGSNVSDNSVRIEIRDSCHEGSSNFTTSTLHKCKKQVLRPYWNLLVFVGWRGFNRESIFAQGFKWRLLNALYTTLVMLLLLYSYSYEVLACQWKLDVTVDTLPLEKPKPIITVVTEQPHNVSNSTEMMDVESFVKTIDQTTSPPNRKEKKRVLLQDGNPACDHIVTSYLIPGLLHFIAYVVGFYQFRMQENEQLDALMEKVFLQATTVQARTASQQNMVTTQRYFLTFGGLWVFSTALLQCLYMWAFEFPNMPMFKTIPKGTDMILFSLEVLGRTVLNSVILAIVMNFVTQCEMIKFYVRGLVMRLQEKSTDLKTAMKDVLTLRQTLSQLNGFISKMTTLAGVILAELIVIGIFLLLVNKNNEPMVWVYRTMFPVVWAAMFAFPLYQAARVNSICLRLHKVALEMRVFGYKGASLLDLDSFMQFVTNTKLRAKLFHISVIPSQLIFVCMVGAFVLLVLIQTSNIGPANLII